MIRLFFRLLGEGVYTTNLCWKAKELRCGSPFFLFLMLALIQ